MNLADRLNSWLLKYRACVWNLCEDGGSPNIELEEEAMQLERQWRDFLDEIRELEGVN